MELAQHCGQEGSDISDVVPATWITEVLFQLRRQITWKKKYLLALQAA
jgi:hypothetical protein